MVHHDGSPVQDSVNPLKVSYGFNWDDKNRTAQEVSLDSNGMAKVKFNFDNETSHVIVDVSKFFIFLYGKDVMIKPSDFYN